MSRLSDAGDRIQGFAHSKRAPYHWATIPVLMFSIEILPRVLRFVITEFGIALLCLKALSQSVAASWYASLEEENDFVLWGTGVPFGTLP